jgi:hypothetical protein
MTTLPPQPAAAAGPPAPAYPATLTYDLPDRVARWRPLVHWLLLVPHFVVIVVLTIPLYFVLIASWFCGVVLGKVPRPLLNYSAMYLRYNASLTAYYYFLHGTYPPFAFAADTTDPGRDPHVRFDVEPQVEGRSRLTIFFRAIMVIPHFFVLYFLGIAAAVLTFIGFFAVLFTAHWPSGLREFVLGYLRWAQRVGAYYLLLTDEYPPFSLD